MRPSVTRRIAGVVAMALAVPAGATGATAGVPQVVQLDLVDSTRPTQAAPGVPAASTRTLPTTVYLPPDGGSAPLILLAHGAAGAPEKFTELATYWADHGYVVAVPRFPLTNDAVPEVVIGDFSEQGRDVSFVVDEVLALSAEPGNELSGRIDPERIGLFGLSLGSLTVWSAVFDDPPGPAVDALIHTDGTTLATDDQIVTIGFPVLVAHSDVDPAFNYADVTARYDVLPVQKYLLTLHGAAHAAVAENTDTPADEAYQQATTAFWDRTLGGQPDAAFPAAIPGVTSFVEGGRPMPAVLPPTL